MSPRPKSKSAVKKTTARKNPVELTAMTLKQRIFVHHLLADPSMNARKAAVLAGYTSEKAGPILLKRNRFVREAVQEFLENASINSKVTAARILQEVDTLALRDIADFCDENGKIDTTNLRKLPAKARRCIESIEVKSGFDEDGNPIQTCKMKLASKLTALELAMKHRGMLDEAGMKKEEQTGGTLNWDQLYLPPDNSSDQVMLRLEQERAATEQTIGAPFEPPDPVKMKKPASGVKK